MVVSFGCWFCLVWVVCVVFVWCVWLRLLNVLCLVVCLSVWLGF